MTSSRATPARRCNATVTFAIPALLVGVAMHGWGMYEKRKLERGSGLARRKWEEAMYWSCWAALGALAIYIALRLFR
jgi:hypothetical protein